MRPRTDSKFNARHICWRDLLSIMYDNYVYGSTVTDNHDNTLTYDCIRMFIYNKEAPEHIYVRVSVVTKYVISATGTRHGRFVSIEELIQYIKDRTKR